MSRSRAASGEKEESALTAKRIAILGSTGSIGRATLDLIRQWEGRFVVTGLAAAGRNVDLLAGQVERVRPAAVSVADEEAARALRARLGRSRPEILVGPEGAAAVAASSGAELVVAAIVGAAGLRPTLAAVEAGLTVALANKEALVVAGEVVTHAAIRSGAVLLPVDSEHNAIHQCLAGGRQEDVRRIVLTASGGPFRTASTEQMARASREEALRHPTWEMGPKITIDSATLMNKGLEVIEARWLFDVGAEAIDVLVHPQSVVHSMVEFRDGSILAQLGVTDMRHPIQYALTWPERWPSRLPPLDLTRVGRLDFETPDDERFPCLRLAYQALASGGRAPAVLNAANEVAVDGFLRGVLALPDIAPLVEETLGRMGEGPASSIEAVLEADREARDWAGQRLGGSAEARG